MAYRTLQELCTETTIVEKSRFIAVLTPIKDAMAVKNLLQTITKEYQNATHYCYAYITKDTQKYSDDGEPQGTAGLPILNVLQANDLTNVLAVVVRYFGGIKLGTGGLARAYGHAVQAVLAKSTIITKQLCNIYQVTLDYAQLPTLTTALTPFGKILQQTYQDSVQCKIAIPTERVNDWLEHWAAVWQGQQLPIKQINQIDLDL